MVSYIMYNGLFADHQHGRGPSKSCMTQLLCVMEDCTQWLDNGNNIDTILFDFQGHLIQFHMKDFCQN